MQPAPIGGVTPVDAGWVTVWVPLIGTGQDDREVQDLYRPDLPDGVAYRNAEIPQELDRGKPNRWGGRGTKRSRQQDPAAHRGDALLDVVRVEIRAADRVKATRAIPEAQVARRPRLLLDAIRLTGRKAWTDLGALFVQERLTADAAQVEAMKDALPRLVRRGLPAGRAVRIALETRLTGVIVGDGG